MDEVISLNAVQTQIQKKGEALIHEFGKIEWKGTDAEAIQLIIPFKQRINSLITDVVKHHSGKTDRLTVLSNFRKMITRELDYYHVANVYLRMWFVENYLLGKTEHFC